MSMLLQQFIAAHLHGTVPLAEIPRILPGLKFPESSPSRIRNPIPHHVQTRLYKLMINRNWIFEFRLRLSGQTLRQRQGMERSSGSVSGKSSISFPSSWLNSLIDFFPISNWSGGDGVGIKPSGINSIAFRHIASFLLRSTDVINRVSIFADFTTTFLIFFLLRWREGGRKGGREGKAKYANFKIFKWDANGAWWRMQKNFDESIFLVRNDQLEMIGIYCNCTRKKPIWC